MQIGLMADSHDHLPRIEQAVEVFNRRQVEFVIHGGDFVAPFALVPLERLQCDWAGVFGNNDGERAGLERRSQGRIRAGPLRMELDGKRLTVIHILEELELDREQADLIIFGHTHKAEIRQERDILLVNPGETYGWLYGRATAAVVDLPILKVELIDL
ncbi:MAG: metallophosphoesterase [Candidatus Methylomirabilales bacterium]